MATLIMCSMIQTSYGAEASPWANAGNAIRQTMQSYVDQRGQGINQQIQQSAMARQQQMMSSMKPQVGPAQFFPECPVLQRITNMPDPACEASSINPAELGQMMGIQSMAKMAAKEYEKSTLGSLECIANRQKVFDSQLIDFQNSLKAMQDQLKQESQIFRDNTNQMMSDMKSNWADLNGGGNVKGEGIDAKTADWTKQFSPTCATYLKSNGHDNKAGLVGMMNKSNEANIAAANFSQALPQIQANIVKDGNILSAAIKSGGINTFDMNSISHDNQKHIQAILDKEKTAYESTVKTISKDIPSDAGFNVDMMDGGHAADAQTKINNYSANHKNNLMRDCMAGKSGATLNDGIKIDSNTINSLITQAGTDGGTAAPGYRNAVMKIMNNPDLNVTLEMKINQIQALERTYKNMVFNSNVGGQDTAQPASQAFAKLASDCETFYNQASADGSPSPLQKAQRTQTAMQNLKNAHDAVGDKIAQSITSKLINCSDNQMNAVKTCTAAAVNPNVEGFCVGNANVCANQIQGCYGEISAKVGQKTARIKNLGLQYNNAANKMIARANQLFTQQKAAVGNLLANIKNKYPGMNFVIGGANGKDDPLMISSPALSKAEFGIDLIAGGNMEEYLKELPNKIGSLQAIIADQQEKAKEQVDAYINGGGNSPVKGLKEYLEESKGKWEKLAGQCKSMVDQSYAAIDAANKEKQKQDNKNAEFCKKYNAFANSESPTCGGAEKLTSNISDIVNSIPGQATSLAYEAEQACASSNNEAIVGGNDVDTAKIKYDSYCKQLSATTDGDLLKKINKSYPIVKNKAQLQKAAESFSFNRPETAVTAEGTSKEQTALDSAIKALKEADKAVKTAEIEKTAKEDTLKRAQTEFNSAAADKKNEAQAKLDNAKTEAAKANLALENANNDKTTAAETKTKAETAKIAAETKKPDGKTEDDTTKTAKKDDSICKSIGSITGITPEQKNEKIAAFVEAAVEVAGASSAAGSSDKLTKIVGQMANSPCGAIASSTGKGGLLPWERPPEAGIGSLGSSK